MRFIRLSGYHLSRKKATQKIEALLSLVELEARADDAVETYSGGMRKRLDIAAGLIHQPKVLFLDEPTLGLDIRTRHHIWKHINHLREEKNMTIFLTTHYMEEADSLCDRIAIIDKGEIRAIDAPEHLKSGLKQNTAALKEPTLDDVYMAFTGKDLKDETGSRHGALQARRAIRRMRS